MPLQEKEGHQLSKNIRSSDFATANDSCNSRHLCRRSKQALLLLDPMITKDCYCRRHYSDPVKRRTVCSLPISRAEVDGRQRGEKSGGC